MGVGLGTGQNFADEGEWLATTTKDEKRRNDSIEMSQNEKSGDFQSRFFGSDRNSGFGMPLEASTELAGALKTLGSTRLPENDQNIKSDRSVLQKLTGSDGGERFQTWPERLARSAFTLPGDVLSGKVEPGSIQEIERATNLASIMIMGPAPVAAKLADGSLGSFAGVRSRTLPRDRLYEAQNMELDATHPDTIWEKTGFFRGVDQRWRYEIPDKDAKLKMDAFEQIDNINHPNFGGERVTTIVPKSPERPMLSVSDLAFPGPKKSLSLDKVIDHPELFKAYPDLKTMKVEPLPEYLKNTGVKGQVVGDTIYLAEEHPEYIRSVLLHEIQHGIQYHEDFAHGGSESQFLPKELPQAEKEFLQIRQTAEKSLEGRNVPVGTIKATLRDELRGIDMKQDVEFLKSRFNLDDKDIQRLRNIVKSEDLIQQAKEEAFTKYQRLMGEVEARNVQARRNYESLQRETIPPYRTEDTPRISQHNPE